MSRCRLSTTLNKEQRRGAGRTGLMRATGNTVRRPQTNGHQERRYEAKHLKTTAREVHVNRNINKDDEKPFSKLSAGKASFLSYYVTYSIK